MQKWRSLGFHSSAVSFWFSRQTCINFFAKKRNEHTWFWKKETGGGADLPCCLWALLRRSVSPCSSVSVPSCSLPLRFNLLYSHCVTSSPPPLFLTFSLSRFSFLFSTVLSVFLCCLVLPSSLFFFFCLSLPVLCVSLFSFLFYQFSFSPPFLLPVFLPPFFSLFFFPSSQVQSSSAAFIGQRRLCAGNGWLCNGLQRDDSRDTCPIIEENWHCFCKKTYLGLYCWNGWKKTLNSVSRQRHRFCNFKWYLWSGPWMFLQFCNQAPG